MSEIPENSPGIEKYLRLISAEGVGSATFIRLLRHFGSLDRALGAPAAELARVERIGPGTAERIAASRDGFDAAAELNLAARLGAWIISIADKRYPVLLKRIYDPPPVLYVKGTLSGRDGLSVAIVGSRRCSVYGQEQACRFAHLLGSAGFTVTSGMARGIDTAAHQGVLSAGGRTIAVQGCGLAHVFPPENRRLFERITRSGSCISDLSLTTGPRAENFPVRNRIIAGLSLGTIVIEAGLRSGAMITARLALENNREVMAVPGKIDSPLSRGTHQLIKQGARLVDCIDDVTEALGYIGDQLRDHITVSASRAQRRMEGIPEGGLQPALAEDERKVYESMGSEPAHIDRITAAAGLQAGSVNAALVSLQLKGLVRQFPGGMFSLRSSCRAG
jgi:DNA processing protein